MPRKRIIKKNIYNEEPEFLKFIDKIYFINLEQRKDRLNNIIKELKKIDPKSSKIERIEAVKKDIGAIGCGLSHIKTLKEAQKKDFQRIIIIEDDFKFVKSVKEINISIMKLLDLDFNICLLSGNINNCKRFKNNIFEAIDVQTTSGYIIEKSFYQTLINNFQNAVEIMENDYKYGQAEIDISWKKLQGENKKFFIFYPKLGKQISGYSDIEKRVTNYNC